jgi:hypothetical protein
MTHQKKKKASPQLQKQQEAENKKRFYQKVKEFFRLLGYEEMFKLIPADLLEDHRLYRYHPPRVINFKEIKISAKDVKIHTENIFTLLHNYKVELPQLKKEIDGYTFCTTYLDFFGFYLKKKKDYKFPDQKIIQETMKDCIAQNFNEKFLNETLANLEMLISFYGFEINSGFLLFSFTAQNDKLMEFGLNLMVRKIDPVKKNFHIDDKFRTAYQVGWIENEQFFPTFIRPEKLNLDVKKYRYSIPVYIQNHALIRLNERMDTGHISFRHFSVFRSMINPVIIQIRDNAYLIEYNFNDFRVGYLVADFIEGNLIIRTFILKTQAGTPEEIKLKELTGLNRRDIDYLGLTKISTFVKSDICKDEQLKKIFIEAGLRSIIDYAGHTKVTEEGRYKYAAKILKYLHVESPTTNWHEVAETIKEEELA